MFDGVAEQFHQFIASSTAAAALSFPSPNGFTSFDPLFSTTTSNSHLQQSHDQFLHHQQQQHQPSQKIINNEDQSMNNMELLDQRDRSMSDPAWSNDEVLALLRIRSSFQNWFPEFTWEHVSRKLAELGFKRRADKCKEKFEEESRFFNSNINSSKNFNICAGEIEQEQFFQQAYQNPPHPHHHHSQLQVVAAEKNKNIEKSREEDNIIASDHDQDNDQKVVENINKLENNHDKSRSNKKRKLLLLRQKKEFEMLKGFCEDIVNKLMAQQEEMQRKLIEDMVKRDEEKFAREEVWKKQEMDRVNHELQLRAKKQAVAVDRQAMVIKFLTKFSSNKKQCFENPNPINKPTSMAEKLQAPQSRNPKTLAPAQNPILVTSTLTVNYKDPQNPTSINNKDDDLGKRWPRDEVLALINLRCSFNGGDNDKEGGAAATATMKGRPWERISQGMLELGYKRSAKRCKEKWENINKYFRKTKDNVNKKRSLDSRTCPYFHQLSTLYNQGTLIIAPSEGPENHSEGTKGAKDSSSVKVSGFDQFEF